MRKRRSDKDGIFKRKDSPYYWASYVNSGGKRIGRSTPIRTGSRDGKRKAEALLAKWTLQEREKRQWGIPTPQTRTFDETMMAYLGVPRRLTPRVRSAARHFYKAWTRVGQADLSGYRHLSA